MTGGRICPPVDAVASTGGSEMRTVTDLLHQRNGKKARGHNICSRASRYGCKSTAGDYRRLGRPAPESSHQRRCTVGKQVRATGLEKHLAEKDKGKDRGADNPYRQTKEGARVEIEVVCQPDPG